MRMRQTVIAVYSPQGIVSADKNKELSNKPYNCGGCHSEPAEESFVLHNL